MNKPWYEQASKFDIVLLLAFGLWLMFIFNWMVSEWKTLPPSETNKVIDKSRDKDAYLEIIIPPQPTGEISVLVQSIAKELGVSYQIPLAIMKLESGNFKSQAWKNKNNPCGYTIKGGLKSFATQEEGIQACISNIKRNYFDKGLTTPELMNSKYAADPNWAKKVRSMM